MLTDHLPRRIERPESGRIPLLTGVIGGPAPYSYYRAGGWAHLFRCPSEKDEELGRGGVVQSKRSESAREMDTQPSIRPAGRYTKIIVDLWTTWITQLTPYPTHRTMPSASRSGLLRLREKGLGGSGRADRTQPTRPGHRKTAAHRSGSFYFGGTHRTKPRIAKGRTGWVGPFAFLLPNPRTNEFHTCRTTLN